MIDLDFSPIHLKIKKEKEKTFVFDKVRIRWLVLTPEEHVRQYILQYLIEILHYPASLIAVEKKIIVGKVDKRFDIVVFNRNHQPWMLVECKEPEVMVSGATLFQLLNYNRGIPCKYWMLTNGHQTFCANAENSASIRWLNQLPAYDS